MEHHTSDALVPTSLTPPLVPPLPTLAPASASRTHTCCRHRRTASSAQKPLGGIAKPKRPYSRSLDQRPSPVLASCHTTVSSPPSLAASLDVPTAPDTSATSLSSSSSSSSSTLLIEPKAPRKLRQYQTLPNLTKVSSARRSLNFNTMPPLHKQSTK